MSGNSERKKMIRIRQDGPSQYQIRQGNKTIGHIWKHSDGWRGKIGVHEAIAATPDDACEKVWANVSGQSIAEIREKNDGISLGMKQSKQYIYRLLAWLAENAARHDGELRYSHADLARVLSPRRPDTMSRVLGNLTSLMDLACVMTELPPIGCTTQEGPFAKAWQPRQPRNWDFPIPSMIQRAKAYRWSAADFERLRLEIQTFEVWSARRAWHDAMEKDEAKIKEWAYR
jgi:hypothetical protein